jgi:hypothetical protein
MQIFFGRAFGRTDVSPSEPVDLGVGEMLEIFRSLDGSRGFLGIILEARFVLQLFPEKSGKIRVELLDQSEPGFDWCIVGREFAEALIDDAGNGQDVFGIARKSMPGWQHMNLPRAEV